MTPQKHETRFNTPTDQSLVNTVLGVIRSAYTVIFVPRHDDSIIHPAVAKILQGTPQPLQASLAHEEKAVRTTARKLVNLNAIPRLNSKELLGLTGVLMQFTLYLPKLRPYCRASWADIDKLYKTCVEQGSKKPLGFDDQLTVALKQTDGDLPEAIWLLFITSRQHARWYDSAAISGLPALSRQAVIDRMATWSRCLAATKPYDSCPDQDVAGDTYYCWTHALAKLAFHVLAAKRRSPLSKLQALALNHGTLLNHSIAHKVSPQSLASDHTAAAAYGNRIGETLADILI